MKLDQKITSKQVRELLGGISDMSLWRFLHDKKLGFPKPIYINRRRLWSHEELKLKYNVTQGRCNVFKLGQDQSFSNDVKTYSHIAPDHL